MITCKIVIEIHFFFFFQAEDGIRDLYVTGVQTCALPILIWLPARRTVLLRALRNALVHFLSPPVLAGRSENYLRLGRFRRCLCSVEKETPSWTNSQAVACAATSGSSRLVHHTGSGFATVSIAASIMAPCSLLPRFFPRRLSPSKASRATMPAGFSVHDAARRSSHAAPTKSKCILGHSMPPTS